ncbi:hypothetical protein AAG570_000120 [Ranatra chinensis]|uniref:CN hydrolase domain-containing protein n=1 Tax=Ranatra chinensis TaxID=642074 RepID=A0ABD0ZD33_9HEMI
MYVVVNLLEESTSQNGSPTRYNTNVVFDREGTVIARYRKYNLYDEPYVNSTESPEHSFFDTDFGVRFGVFTCFDILFKEPGLTLWRQYNVTDFVYPTAWFSKLPHLTAIGVQWGWSYATGATLLASGENSVRQSHSGSGIYRGAAPPLAYRLADVDGSFMLLATLPKTGRSFTIMLNCYSRGVNYVVNRTLCQGKFCCHFYAEVSVNIGPRDATLLRGDDFQFFRYEYMMAVFDGVRDFHGQGTGGSQVCGIVACLEGELCRRDGDMALAEVTMAGSFQGEHSFIAPNIFLASHSAHRFGQLPTPPTFNFVKSPKPNGKVSASLQFGFNASLISASIYSRVFDRDGQPPSTAGSSTGTWSFLLCVAISLVFLLRSSRTH